MTFPEIPADVSAGVKRLFRGDNRKKIAMELMFFDHWPTTDERKEISSRYGLEHTTVDKVLYKLRDNDYFTKEQGSIPLYRVRLRNEIPEVEHDRVDLQDRGLNVSVLKDELEEEPVLKDDVEPSDDPVEEDLEGIQQENRLKKMEVTIHNQGEKFDNFMAEMRTTINRLAVAPAKDNPGHVESPVDAPPNPLIDQPNTLIPFENMSGTQVYEMLMNQPREFMEIMGLPNRPPQGDIQAVPVTVRKVIVDVTTYTLTCYEKAVNDGAFDGTFSDFMNQCVYKYFEDRGLALGWHKVEQLRRFSS